METPYIFENIPFPAVEGNPRNGEGDAVVLDDGRVLMVYGEFTGPSDHSEGTLQGVISSDSGRTWQDKHTVQDNIGGMNVMSVSLHRLANGEILLGFLRKDEVSTHCTPFVRRSADEGKTWSEPEPVVPVTSDYYVVNNDRVVQLEGGRVLMPAHLIGETARLGDAVFRSDDQGKTWTRSDVHPFLPESKSDAQEPGLVELRDGRIMMICRCDLGQIYRCYSTDGAETFGDWEPMGLKAPCSPGMVKRLPASGHLMCIFNNHEVPPEYWAVSRAPLTVALSTDEAETWKVVGDLEPDRTSAYCYTSVTFLPDEEILLTYYHGRTIDSVVDGKLVRQHRNLSHLKVGVFKESWVTGR